MAFGLNMVPQIGTMKELKRNIKYTPEHVRTATDHCVIVENNKVRVGTCWYRLEQVSTRSEHGSTALYNEVCVEIFKWMAENVL